MRYWSNRCGDIAASQFPLIVALASKNNIIGCTPYLLISIALQLMYEYSVIVGVGWEKVFFFQYSRVFIKTDVSTR